MQKSFYSSLPVLAAGEIGKLKNPALSKELQLTVGVEYFATLIPKLVTFAFIIGSIIFFFLLLIGGIQWMTSGGDKAKLETARGRLTNAVIGLVILFSVFAIVSIIELIFDVSILSLDIGALMIQ